MLLGEDPYQMLHSVVTHSNHICIQHNLLALLGGRVTSVRMLQTSTYAAQRGKLRAL